MSELPYPLVGLPVPVPKPWGGDSLARLLRLGQGDSGPIGEVWALSPLAERPTMVANGLLAGLTIEEARRRIGPAAPPRGAPLGLLVKFLEAVGALSVQVHPDDGAARAREGPPARGKTECWRVLVAQGGARVVHGLAPGVGRAGLEAAIRAGTVEERSLFRLVHPVAGDFFPIPPGTVHTAAGGLVWAEVQTASDITYRLWDWGRIDPTRPLTLDKGMAVVREEVAPLPHRSLPLSEGPTHRNMLWWATPRFVVEEVMLSGTWVRQGMTARGYELVVAIEGGVGLTWRGHSLTLATGRTAYVPGSGYALSGEGASALLVYEADLAREVVGPLAARGVSASDLARVVLDD